MPDSSCRMWINLACIAGLAAAGTAQNQQLLEDTVRRLEAKLDQIDGYLTGLEPGDKQTVNNGATDPERSRLEHRAAELERQINESKAAYEEKLQDREIEARTTREAAAERERALQTQLEALKMEMEQARLRASEADARTQRDREILVRSETEAKTNREHLDVMTQERDRMAADRESLTTDLASSRARLAEVDKSLATVESLRQKIEARERDLTARLDRLEGTAAQDQRGLQARAQEYETQLGELRAQLGRANTRNDELSRQVIDSKETIDSLSQEISQLEDRAQQGDDGAALAETVLENAQNPANPGIHVHNDRGTVILQVGGGSIGLRDEALKSSQQDSDAVRRGAARTTAGPRSGETARPPQGARPLGAEDSGQADHEPEPAKPVRKINV